MNGNLQTILQEHFKLNRDWSIKVELCVLTERAYKSTSLYSICIIIKSDRDFMDMKTYAKFQNSRLIKESFINNIT